MVAPEDPNLRAGLNEGRAYLVGLHGALHALRQRGENNTDEFRELVAITGEVGELVGQAWMTLHQGHILPPDSVVRLIHAGKLQEAAQAVAEQAQDNVRRLQERFAELQQLRQRRPVTRAAGTNLAADAAAPWALTGRPGPPVAEEFAAAHPAARKLAILPKLRPLIAAGDDAARAQLALLTAVVEYGDKLAAPMPDMRVRPPATSPFLPVYDKMKRLLELFPYGGARVNLLNPGRMTGLMQNDREASLKAVALTLQNHPTMKKDAEKIATELRDAFETEMNTIFAGTVPEVGALRDVIAGLCAGAGVPFSPKKANLLLNPHLEPARGIAQLAQLIGEDEPARGAEEALELALAIRRQLNARIQATLHQLSISLFQELGGDPALYAAHTLSAGNMADASGLPLAAGNEAGALDYVALLNNGYDGQVVIDAIGNPYFATAAADPEGIPLFAVGAAGETGRDFQTALALQPLKMDVARHFEHPAAVTVTVGDGPGIVIEYHRAGRGYRPELAGELPPGMDFDPERYLLSLGPAHAAGQPYRVDVAVRSREVTGDWEDFVILLAQALSPHQNVMLTDVFAPGQAVLKPGLKLLPDAPLQAMAGWLRQGAGLALAELVGNGVNPEPAAPQRQDHPAMNATHVAVEFAVDGQTHEATVRLAIDSWADPNPALAYRELTPEDPNGSVGLSQDRSVAAVLAILEQVVRELVPTGHLDQAAGLRRLADELQMQAILKPARPPGGPPGP